MICTYTGLYVDPLNLDPSQVSIRDIAHALSLTCRFGGHIKRFYSVAEHCLVGEMHLESELEKLAFLLHDAAEAYIGDIVGPIKRRNLCINHRGIEMIESGLLDAICAGLRLDSSVRVAMDSAPIKQLDHDMCDAEKSALCLSHSLGSAYITIPEQPIDDVEEVFIAAFLDLSRNLRTEPKC